MQVTVYGLLVWRLLLTKHASNILMHFASKASGVQPLWDFIVIADTEMWRVGRCKALPPCRVAEILAGGPQDAIPPGLALVPLGRLAPLLKWSANEGFPNVIVPHLQKLCKGRGLRMRTRLPHRERACTGLLLKDILPNMASERHEGIMVKRGLAKAKGAEQEDLLTLFLDEEKLDDIAEHLEPEQIESVKKVLRERGASKPKKQNAGATAAAAKASSSSSGSGPSVATARRMPIAAEASSTLAAAKRYVPQTLGCAITKDTKWHNRWCITYPCKVPPRSFRKSWGDGSTVDPHGCMVACIRWAWEKHTEATGQDCPWDS